MHMSKPLTLKNRQHRVSHVTWRTAEMIQSEIRAKTSSNINFRINEQICIHVHFPKGEYLLRHHVSSNHGLWQYLNLWWFNFIQSQYYDNPGLVSITKQLCVENNISFHFLSNPLSSNRLEIRLCHRQPEPHFWSHSCEESCLLDPRQRPCSCSVHRCVPLSSYGSGNGLQGTALLLQTASHTAGRLSIFKSHIIDTLLNRRRGTGGGTLTPNCSTIFRNFGQFHWPIFQRGKK